MSEARQWIRDHGSDEVVCPCCDQKVRKLNPHHMDACKVRVLSDIEQMNSTHEWIKAKNDGTLTAGGAVCKTEELARNHASRLHWFGLLDYQGHRTGCYQINECGRAFLRGQQTVPLRILCKNGRVVEESTERVYLHEIAHVRLRKDYWDSYAGEQKDPFRGHGGQKVE